MWCLLYIICSFFHTCENMSQNGSKSATFDGYLMDGDHLRDTNWASSIRILPTEGNDVFHITRIMLYLLYIKGLLGVKPMKMSTFILRFLFMCVFRSLPPTYLKSQSNEDFYIFIDEGIDIMTAGVFYKFHHLMG